MTAVNQNFEMYAGDSKNIVVSVTDGASRALDITGASMKWILRPTQATASNIIEKSTPEIILDVYTATIKLLPEDTESLAGNYYHEAELTDQIGNVSTVMVGNVKINRSFA
jgi:hypothetical protein